MQTPQPKRRCTKCKKKKDVSEFYTRPDGKTKLWSHCKQCSKAKYQEWQRRPEVAERLKKKARERYAADPEYRRKKIQAVHKTYRTHKDKIQARQLAWAIRNKERVYHIKRKAHLKGKYAISPEIYAQMLQDQHGRCAICGSLPNGTLLLVVDHDHTTGKTRGLLCYRCNTALGLLKEDPALFAQALAYLRSYAREEVMQPYGKISLQTTENGGTRP